MILSAGLSPAWQQLLTFDRFRTNAVNRATASFWFASGKPINVGSALANLGTPHRVVVPLGGATGRQAAVDAEARGIELREIAIAGETRVCTTIVEPLGSVTELVPEAPPLTAEELRNFREAVKSVAPEASAAVFIGSLPPGIEDGLYAECAARFHCPVVIDASGRTLLAALSAKPHIVKPNRSELELTTSLPCQTLRQLSEAARRLVSSGAANVIVTDGPRAVHWVTKKEHWICRPPEVDVVNPIGCGDCFAGVLAWCAARGVAEQETLRMAVAAAAINAGALLPASFSRATLAEWSNRCCVESVSADGPL